MAGDIPAALCLLTNTMKLIVADVALKDGRSLWEGYSLTGRSLKLLNLISVIS
jgi:hypothetical protein